MNHFSSLNLASYNFSLNFLNSKVSSFCDDTPASNNLSSLLSVVARGDQQVGQVYQLVFSEGFLMLSPVVLVSSLETLQTLLNCGWNWLLVMQEVPQINQQGWDKVWYCVGEGSYKSTQTKDSPVSKGHLLSRVNTLLLVAV